MKTTINLTERDLEVINWLKMYTLNKQGVNLNTTQILKKALYNEKYFLSEEWKKEPDTENYQEELLPFN